MKFAEALQQETHTQGPPCSVATVLDQLDAEDRAALLAALDNGTPLTAIARALNAVGYRITAHTIGRHRKGDCRCG